MTSEADRIVAEVEKAGHSYLSFDDIEGQHPGSRRTVNFLRDEDRLKIIGNQFVMTETVWNEIIGFIEEKLEAQGRTTVAEFRDRFGSSRKFALPVLEYLDRLGITRREGDYRIKGASFNERHLL
jgi:selenocysteine-specific elongation factor